jgi:two-component system sensor histidine kinase KdpD
MTRLESGAAPLNLQWHVLEELVGSALARLQRELEHHSVRTDLPADLPLLHVEGELLTHVFVGLLENAVRHTPPGSAIEIAAHPSVDAVEITVADNGPGLPRESEEQVFEKFFRGRATSPDGRRGIGLGLAICRAVLRAHGGWITARNRPSGGAEFVVTVPCKDQPPQIRTEQGLDQEH